MKSILRRITRTKGRIAVVIAASLVVFAGTAFAAWLLIANGTGTTTIPTGSSGQAPAATVTVNPANGTALVPGGTENVTWSAMQSSGQSEQVDAATLSVTGTSNNTACPASNFTVTQGGVTQGGTLETLPYSWASGQQISGGQPSPSVTMSASAPTGCQNVSVDVAVSLS
jgi:hypothetical protein